MDIYCIYRQSQIQSMVKNRRFYHLRMSLLLQPSTWSHIFLNCIQWNFLGIPLLGDCAGFEVSFWCVDLEGRFRHLCQMIGICINGKMLPKTNGVQKMLVHFGHRKTQFSNVRCSCFRPLVCGQFWSSAWWSSRLRVMWIVVLKIPPSEVQNMLLTFSLSTMIGKLWYSSRSKFNLCNNLNYLVVEGTSIALLQFKTMNPDSYFGICIEIKSTLLLSQAGGRPVNKNGSLT